jgi:ribosomal protein S24E
MGASLLAVVSIVPEKPSKSTIYQDDEESEKAEERYAIQHAALEADQQSRQATWSRAALD